MTWRPRDDGIDHLNVYSNGRTELGRFLSNFAHTPIDTEDGHFESIEGYWYWLGLAEFPYDCDARESLRLLHGKPAKVRGRVLKEISWVEPDDFQTKILAAIAIKLESNPAMLAALQHNELTLAHYYLFGRPGEYPRVIEPEGNQWMLDFLTSYMPKSAQSYPYRPTSCSPPGATIQDILEEREVPISEFAESISRSEDFVNALFVGDALIDAELAELLCHALGPPANFWMRREAFYREMKEKTS